MTEKGTVEEWRVQGAVLRTMRTWQWWTVEGRLSGRGRPRYGATGALVSRKSTVFPPLSPVTGLSNQPSTGDFNGVLCSLTVNHSVRNDWNQ